MKDRFDHRPTLPSVRTTRAVNLTVRFALDPKGDCKVTGNEETNQLQFYEGNPFQNE